MSIHILELAAPIGDPLVVLIDQRFWNLALHYRISGVWSYQRLRYLVNPRVETTHQLLEVCSERWDFGRAEIGIHLD